MSTTLVIGLGNYGSEYASTRHNIGWMSLAALEKQGSFHKEKRLGPLGYRQGTMDGLDMMLVRPYTYMNLSGMAGKMLVRKWKIDPKNAIVIHDDLDLPFGRLRIRQGGSSGGQKGVESLIQAWATREFIRIRIGIGRPPEGMDAVDYVLEKFLEDELQLLPAIFENVKAAVECIATQGIDQAMSKFNQFPKVIVSE